MLLKECVKRGNGDKVSERTINSDHCLISGTDPEANTLLHFRVRVIDGQAFISSESFGPDHTIIIQEDETVFIELTAP